MKRFPCAATESGRMAPRSKVPLAWLGQPPRGVTTNLRRQVSGMPEPTTLPDSQSGPSVSQGSLYRYYDVDGTLLYIGVTKRGRIRNFEHSSDKEWWPFVARQDVEHFATYDEALASERSLIFDLRPPFNIQHNPDHAVLRRLYLWLAESRADGDKTLSEYLQTVGRRMPLVVLDDGSRSGVFTFLTMQAQSSVVDSLSKDVNRDEIRVRPSGGGKNLGCITSIAVVSGRAFIRGKLYKNCELIDGTPVAKIKIVTMKKPTLVRLTAVEIEPLP